MQEYTLYFKFYAVGTLFRKGSKKTENIARERKRQGKEELKRKCKKGDRDTAGKEAKEYRKK